MRERAGDSCRHVVVIGTGQGGFQVAASLRDNGFAGSIHLIGDEDGLPYQRPPLSKAYLAGTTDRTTLALRPASFFAQAAIDISAGRRVARIDRTGHTVALADGAILPYDHLVLATGARNRLLPVQGAELDGVAYLRTAAEGDALRQKLSGLKRVVIVGAGFIGLELAAFAAARGLDVTVLEAASRPMARALSDTMSSFFRRAHEAAGVRFVFNAAVTCIHGINGRASAVETADGTRHAADLVLIGIGIVPNVELAVDAGLATDNGIVVDDHLVTGDPAISAIGDCAAFPQPFADGARGRIESVQNAVDHGRCVAARLTGAAQPYRAVPWFWSDQGPLKLQIAGLPAPHDHHVVRGDPASGAFSVFCFRDGRLAGVESVNKPGDHMVGRRVLGTSLTPAQAADLTLDLKALASTKAVAA
ncbi:NAD(P)/FAD-dependent oxidoreductase [Bradyrhizobium sp. 2TAF24]|uniref:NAD(P)/FAD-dependent oxidoreductase n=1 Tax=Bradyrhizobium sp. 2TAF24 TaxID=3233011 RepID=UPI003F8FBE7C